MKNKTIFSFILIMVLSIFSSVPTYADTVANESQNINLYISENFKKQVYKPGDSDNLKFVIENNTTDTIKIKKLYLSKNDSTASEAFEELAKYTEVVIKNNDSIIIKGLLSDILDKGKFNVNLELSPKQSLEFDMSINMSIDMGNKAQNCYEELSISTDYEIYSNDDHINDNNQSNSGNNNTGNGENNSNDNNQNVGEGSLPQTGAPYDYSMFIVILIAIALIFMYRKEIIKILKIKG